MDEIRMVRELYPDPAPPTAQEIARAAALIEAPARRVSRRLRWGLGGVAVAGVAAAVAVAVTVVSIPSPSRPPASLRGVSPRTGGGGPTPAVDAMAAVLTAADQAAQQPFGQYWYTDAISDNSGIVQAVTGRYAITGIAATENFRWTGANRGMGEGGSSRQLPARPVSAADVAAWHRAGSPSTFEVWAGDHYDTATTTGTAWQPNDSNPHGGGDFSTFAKDGKPAIGPAKDLLSLPTDPASLAKIFLNPGMVGQRPGSPPNSMLLVPAGYALADTPLPPKVRAGLIRAMADLPGVSALGTVTDPLGRKGIALADPARAYTVTGKWGTPRADQGTYYSRDLVVLDPTTGSLLAVETVLTRPGTVPEYRHLQPGFVFYYDAIRSQGWTDTKPAGPSAQLPPGY